MGPGGCLPPASLLVNSLQVTGAVGHVIAQMRGSPASRGAHGHTHNPPPVSVRMGTHRVSGGRAPEMLGGDGAIHALCVLCCNWRLPHVALA